MNIDEVFKKIESYYGEYKNQELKAFVVAYIIKDHKAEKYDEVLKSILYFHQANFGAPCIATIEDCVKKARIEKNQVDSHKGITTKNKWDFKEQAKTDKSFDKVDINLKEMFKDKIKKV